MFLMRSQFALVLAVAGLLCIPELSGAQDSLVEAQVAAASGRLPGLQRCPEASLWSHMRTCSVW
jgi:hypothetical protein